MDGERADAASPAVDQHALTRREIALVEERLPSRQRRQRHGGGLGVRRGGGLGQKFVGPHGDEVRVGAVTTEIDQSENFIPDLDPCGTRSDVLDDPGYLMARDDGRCAWGAVMAEPCPVPVELTRRDAAGVDPDQNVSGSKPGQRRLLDDESGGVVLSIGVQGTHVVISSWRVGASPSVTGRTTQESTAQGLRESRATSHWRH